MRIIPDLWRYAAACYCGIENMQKLLKNKIIAFTPMENNLDSGCIIEESDRIIIAFRGTKNLSAWISDFNVYPLQTADSTCSNGSWGQGTIADGFYDGWFAFKDTITDYLKNNNSTSKLPVYITGHSRGGALAVLCARHIAKNLKTPCSCITFGAPTPGIKAFRDEMNLLPIDLLNIIHGAEFTQDVPPYVLGFRYAGRMEFLTEPFWHKIFSRIADHYPKTVTKRLIAWCKDHQDQGGIDAMNIILSTYTNQ